MTRTSPMDGIGLEIMRHQVQALCEEGAAGIARTAVSPSVVEGGDFSCTLLDADGRLVCGGGKIAMHFYPATNAVRGVLGVYGEDVGEDDVFLSNDPHDGGGLHAQDVYVMRPVFVGAECVAWIANSAHMVDMGGMVAGSFAPDATECYQEAIRTPPVRLACRGVEQRDIWRLLLNNVRVADTVEMDLRGLVAGSHIAGAKVAEFVRSIGPAAFQQGVDDLNRRTEAAVRQQIGRLADGLYRSTSWVEWRQARFRIPCALTIAGDRIRFDFEGASPQTAHFFNSKDYIVKGKLGVDLQPFLARGLPLNEGFYAALDVHCPRGSILNCEHPAPVGAAHIMACHDAVEAALRALQQAAAASPDSAIRQHMSGPRPMSAYSILTWAGPGIGGAPDAWMMLDAAAVGASAGHDRDGGDLNPYLVGEVAPLQTNDIEITEAWFPVLFDYRRRGSGVDGAGQWRGGAGVEFAFQTHGSPGLEGAVTGGHGLIPLPGLAGGRPGRPTQLGVCDGDGAWRTLDNVEQGVRLRPGDRFVAAVAGGGGWGDPLDRSPADVERDIADRRITADEARSVYGVEAHDAAATEALREQRLADRLARAVKPPKPPVAPPQAPRPFPILPLAPGVGQQGDQAISLRSGALLALAPDHWTNGCPMLTETVAAGVVSRSYLDPITGNCLHVEVALSGAPRSFESSPSRWTCAAASIPAAPSQTPQRARSGASGAI